MNKIKALIQYCLKNGIELSIPKKESSQGFLIWNTAQVSDLSALERVAKPLKWSVIHMKKSYIQSSDTFVPERFYVGPVNKKAITEDDLLAHASKSLQ